MHVSRNNFVQIERCNRVDRLYYTEVTEVFAPGGGHVNDIGDLFEDAVIPRMLDVFGRRQAVIIWFSSVFGEDRQPWRKRMLYFERRQSFVASDAVLEKARSHRLKLSLFSRRGANIQLISGVLEAHTTNVRMKSKS